MTPLTKYDNSMIREFQACPRKFFLRYALHLTSKDRSNKFKAEFGSAIHAGLSFNFYLFFFNYFSSLF